MTPLRRGFPFKPFQEKQTLPNLPHTWSAHPAGGPVFYLLPVPQAGVCLPRILCATRPVTGPRLPRPVRSESSLCPLLRLPNSAHGFYLVVHPPRPSRHPPPGAQLPHFGDAHLHFLQHLEELRRLKDTKRTGRERGISQRSTHQLSGSPAQGFHRDNIHLDQARR